MSKVGPTRFILSGPLIAATLLYGAEVTSGPDQDLDQGLAGDVPATVSRPGAVTRAGLDNREASQAAGGGTHHADRAEILAMIDRAAGHSGIDRDLVHALIAAESGYDPAAVSPVGAIGLMQLMPGTAADYGISSPAVLFDPETNVHIGLRHLERLLAKFGQIGPAVVAYNAGEGTLTNGETLQPETLRYAHRVLVDYLRAKGVAPYSEQASVMIGLSLRPTMANAVKTIAPVWPRSSRQPDGRWHATLAHPRLHEPLPARERRLAPRLKAPTLVRARPNARRAPPRLHRSP